MEKGMNEYIYKQTQESYQSWFHECIFSVVFVDDPHTDIKMEMKIDLKMMMMWVAVVKMRVLRNGIALWVLDGTRASR